MSLINEQNDIQVNWLFFDQSHPNDDRLRVRIPCHLFNAESECCRDLFSTQLRDKFNFKADLITIKFMQPKNDLSLDDSLEEDWMTGIKNMRTLFKIIPLARSLVTALREHINNDDLVHLVVTANGTYQRENTAEQPNDQCDLIKRYRNILSIKGKSPSEGAKSTEYPIVQANPHTAIHDGRYPPHPKFLTIAPPLEIFHPVFAGFLHLVRDSKVQPTNQDIRHVRELFHYAAMVGSPGEAWRHAEIRRKLTKILQLAIHEEPNNDRTSADSVHMITVGDIRIPILILELKRELGHGGCDPTTQAGISMRRSWIQEDRAEIRDKCCCPTLMLTGGGPWLGVMGGVFTDKFIVQRLTSLMWIGESSTEEDTRVYDAARVFIALRTSLQQLETFYNKISKSKIPRVINNQTHHPRFYPYPTSFTVDNQTFRFEYLRPMENHAACETYQAKLVDASSDIIVVKFVSRYGREVHEFLADKNYAPRLRYYGPMPEAPPSPPPPPRPENAPAGLAFGFMQMVVMDYIVPAPAPPMDARQQLYDVLSILHAEGYVFGDLREPNILFDTNNNNKIKLIDFNWCGRYNIVEGGFPPTVPDDVQKKSLSKLGPNEYAHYPSNLSTSIEWPAGVKSLEPILPRHDWDMWDKLWQNQKKKKMGRNEDGLPKLGPNECAHYPSNLSTSIEWPAGVKSLEPILPRHDWDMWDKLWVST